MSSSYFIGKGVPQGAVLSPILFTIFLADIFEIFGYGIRCLVYADDIFIYYIGDSIADCRIRLQDALRVIFRWCSYWNMSVRPDKCYAINLSRRRDACDFQFSIGCGLINWADEVKFLGCYFFCWGGGGSTEARGLSSHEILR